MPAVPDPNERGSEPSAGAGRRLHTRSLIVLGALLLLAFAAFAVTERGADREASDERARAADQAVGAIRAQLAATRADVRGIVGVFSTARTIDDFAQFAQPALANPSLDAVSWAPARDRTLRSAFERERGFAISEPAAGGIRTAAERAVYYPTTFVAPDGGERPGDRRRPVGRPGRRRRRQGGHRRRHRPRGTSRRRKPPVVRCC